MKYDLNALDIALQNYIREKDLPGLTVAIRGPEGAIFEKGYGYGDENQGCPLNEHTIMGIASMSKSTVSLALCILAAEGRFDWNDPVTKYFPNFNLKGSPRDAITCHHLACHTSGLAPLNCMNWSIVQNTPGRSGSWAEAMRASAPNNMATIEQVIDYIASDCCKALGGPGEYMSYSNDGYAILCGIFDKAAGEPLEQFLTRRVFQPMGMFRTVLDEDCSEARKLASDGNITRLWDRDSKGNLKVDDLWGIMPPFRSCACVKSTAHDFARYYQCLSNHGMIDGIQAIPAAAADMMCGPQFPLGEKPYYCYGLRKSLWKGHVICEHSGKLHGVSSQGGFLLGENCSFVAFCNATGVDMEPVCWMMSNLLMDRPLEEEQLWLHPTGRQFSQPEMLVGTYACEEGNPDNFEVFTDDGQLQVRQGSLIRDCVHCGETWFLLYNKQGNRVGRCHFWVREGKAWGVQVITRIYQRKTDTGIASH